ncbi:MAG TPA: tetratricopeptide repeat protein [Verrucomicrobiales bacterium]|jgi:Tfp pilus assembly protein PilF|nr:tetratricopeptide repeat protein [Verrucomicrobiales bacterium]
MKTLIIRGLVILLLVAASWMAVKENRKPERPPPSQVSLTTEDGSASEVVAPEGGYRNGIQFFIYIMIVALTIGVIVLKWIIPALGDHVAESFYSAPEKAEQTETQKAMALVAQGEYHKALAAFGRILEQTPNDRFAVTEMAKIYQSKLDDVDSAAEVLEKAIAGDWPEDDKCFFMLKLADLHSTNRHDFARAREILDQLIQTYPESRHAGNAHHKLREIEEQEFIAKRQAH